jgi:polar amino acid transport system substrate-binding protein
MKKVCFILLSAVFLFSGIAYAKSMTIFAEQIEPAHYKDKDGNVVGYVIDLIKAIQKKIGNNDPTKVVPWKRGYTFATDPDETNVILFSTTFTESRRDLFKWVGPVDSSVWQLYGKADTNIVINSLDDAKKLKSIGTYMEDVRDQYLNKQGFTNLDAVYDNSLNLNKLIIGRISLWATSEGTARRYCEKAGFDFNKLKIVYTMRKKCLFIVFNKNTSDEIVNAWQKAYDELKADGTMARIYESQEQSVPSCKIPPAP